MARPQTLASIPHHGSGIGFRSELKEAIWAHRDQIDCVEIITDRYIEHPQLLEELEETCSRIRVIPHGIGLSVGSPQLRRGYLDEVRRICEITRAPYYSEHLCMTSAPGIDIGHLAPLWFTEEVLANTIANVNRLQDHLGRPLVLENTTYPFEIPDADMSQAEFFRRMVGATGCGILLDITNVRINAENHGFDPVAFLDELPLDHVVQLHLAGGYRDHDGKIIDGHCAKVDDETWDLLAIFAAKAQPLGSILEHDSEFPDDFSPILDTVVRARAILGWNGSSAAAAGG